MGCCVVYCFCFFVVVLGFFGVCFLGGGVQSLTFVNENNIFLNWRIENNSVNPNSTFLTLLQVQKMT